MTDVTITPSAGASAAATRPAPQADAERPVFRPRVDLLDREQEVLLFADMPGSRAEDIEIHFENGLLTVRGRVADRPAGPHSSTTRRSSTTRGCRPDFMAPSAR